MYYKNCIALFAALFILSLVSTEMNAQVEPKRVDTPSVEEDRGNNLRQRITFGPHYKSPQAAGRLLVLNRVALVASESSKKVKLSSPAYKNRKAKTVKANIFTSRQYAKRRLSGPRYKNRSAKSRQRQ